MSNAKFQPGTRATVKNCAEGSHNYKWGFRVGDSVTVEVPDMRANDVDENAVYVENDRTKMIGYFSPDDLSAI